MRPHLSQWVENNKFEDIGFNPHSHLLSDLLYFDHQMETAGIRGHIAEIGVAEGQLFLPLMMLGRDNELGVAIDVFDDIESNFNIYGGTSRLRHIGALVEQVFGSLDLLRTVSGDSIALEPHALDVATANGRFRWFSIDGAHSAHHTASDLWLAGQRLAPGGIVLVDDIKNWGWPGVIEAVARYFLLNDHTKLVPFFLWGNKLCMTTHSHHGFWLEKSLGIAERIGRKRANIDYRISPFFGYPVLGY